jgi:hypothetical protein
VAAEIARKLAQTEIGTYEDPPLEQHQILNITAATLRGRKSQVRTYIRAYTGYTAELLAVGVQHVHDGRMPREAYENAICAVPILGAANTSGGAK